MYDCNCGRPNIRQCYTVMDFSFFITIISLTLSSTHCDHADVFMNHHYTIRIFFCIQCSRKFPNQVTANLMCFVIKAEIRRYYVIVKNDYIQIMPGLSARV